MKEWTKSRTIWLALLQGIVGILVAVSIDDPAFDLAGYIAILKSIIDILLRLRTNEELQI
jgi:hypothetical protein